MSNAADTQATENDYSKKKRKLTKRDLVSRITYECTCEGVLNQQLRRGRKKSGLITKDTWHVLCTITVRTH
uniref:Uncharacterized protein n=1 Tax=Daphnia magna TaxID=35525 RepID=A0A0P6BHI0_9CRUS